MNRSQNIIRKVFFFFWEFIDLISSKENSDDQLKIRKPTKFLKIVSRRTSKDDALNLGVKNINQLNSKRTPGESKKITGTYAP